tara:strand:+ start:2887 stop:3063 length:177 start_codon:yes stop_codon:yes gene_type:complete
MDKYHNEWGNVQIKIVFQLILKCLPDEVKGAAAFATKVAKTGMVLFLKLRIFIQLGVG